MTNIIDKIKNPIREEMALFEEKFLTSIKSEISLLDKISQFIITKKGKQIRPILVFLCAKLVGRTTEKTFRAASMIELIHTATLIHDDVVDESYMRRDFFSINALWKNKIAVLVGDYLLSKSVIISTENKDYDVLEIISRTIKEMAEGELLQLEKSRKLDITEEVYFEIIRKKTASLIMACCEVGVISNEVDENSVEKIRNFGLFMGLAFQIKDDLFDYHSQNLIGKPVAIDIREQKMTLPLIYSLENANEKNRKYHFDTIKRYNKNPKRVEELIDFVKNTGGLDYAINVMEDYKQKALSILENFPDNEAKKSLSFLLDYVIKRKF